MGNRTTASKANHNQPNKMAEAAAAVRAVHWLHEQSVIFDDPYAFHLISPGWKLLARNRWFYRVGVRKIFVDKLTKFTERRGERLISQFDAKTLPDELNSLGYTMTENISQADCVFIIMITNALQISDRHL